MKNIFKKFYRISSSYRGKLLLAFLLCTLIPVSLIAGISYKVSYKIASEKIIDSVKLAGTQLEIQISNTMLQAENVSDALQHDLYALNGIADKDLFLQLNFFTSLRSDISLYSDTFDFSHIFVLLDKDIFGSDEDVYFFNLDKLNDFDIDKNDLKNLGASSKWFFKQDIQLPRIVDQKRIIENAIICSRSMHNQQSGKIDYAFFIVIDASVFSDLLKTSFLDNPIDSYLITNKSEIIASSSAEQLNKKITDETFDKIRNNYGKIFENNNSLVYPLELNNGLSLMITIPKNYILSGTAVLLRSIIIALVITLTMTLIIIFLITRKLTSKILLLSDAMNKYSLNDDYEDTIPKLDLTEKDPEFYDEIDNLWVAFEAMNREIQKNIQSVLDLSLTEERLKYQLLQSQINPHFLYNILESIKTCQSLGKIDVANQMISDLTRFYRLSLRKSDVLITIEDEIEIIDLYLKMENLCHNNRINWNINLDDGIENFLICRFTLQPFIENSIKHGMSSGNRSININISAEYGDDTVIIIIEDDGIGMDQGTLNEVLEQITNGDISYNKNFGISNVNGRISSELYGNGELKITSKKNIGTKVRIEFDQMIEGLNNEKSFTG